MRAVLFHKETFLLFNFIAQFFFCWHISHILGCKQLIVVVKNRITCYRIVGICAEQHSNSRSVISTFDKVIIHSYIHVKLTNILVCEFMCL